MSTKYLQKQSLTTTTGISNICFPFRGHRLAKTDGCALHLTFQLSLLFLFQVLRLGFLHYLKTLNTVGTLAKSAVSISVQMMKENYCNLIYALMYFPFQAKSISVQFGELQPQTYLRLTDSLQILVLIEASL